MKTPIAAHETTRYFEKGIHGVHEFNGDFICFILDEFNRFNVINSSQQEWIRRECVKLNRHL